VKPRLSGVLLAMVVVLVAILLGWGFASLWTLRADFDESQSAFTASQRDVSSLRDQLLSLGQTPRVDPPRGEQGDQGDRGPAGRDGRDAVALDGRDGRDGMTPPCFFAPTQCVGAPGKDGADSTVPGPKGDKGDPGADSTVPGPPGPPGADGQPPQSFTFTWANRTYRCSDGNSDGHYECTDNDPVPV